MWAVLQLVLPLAAAQADAWRSLRGTDVRPHVEDASAACCHRVHTEDCAVCKHLSLPTLAPSAPAMGVVMARAIMRPAAAATSTTSARRSAVLPRAPPTHS